MGVMRLGGMTVGSLFKKPETVCYPAVTKEAPAGLKGVVQNNTEECIGCGICAKRCPADAIEVDRNQGIWSMDPLRCIQCCVCVRECPKKCLSMDTTRPAATTQKVRVQYSI